MPGRKSLIVVAAVALLAAWMFVARRGDPEPAVPVAEKPAVPVAEKPAAPAPAPPAGGVAPLRQDPGSPARTMPYRPAKLLRYSEGIPSTIPSDDDRSPILARILAVTQATPAQQHEIRQLWRAHEDGRRILLGEAHPPSIGLPVLEPQRLALIEATFEAALFGEVLTPAQRQRLALELGPPGESR